MEEQTKNCPSVGEVLQELRAIGLSRATDCLQLKDGKVELDPKVLEGQAGAAILSMEYSDKGWKLKFCDKLKALEMLGEHFGLFKERSAQEKEDCNLLQAILASTGEDMQTDALQELQ